MTGSEILDLALPLMGASSDDKTDYEEAALPLLNLFIAENFEINNSILEANGDDVLTAIPVIASLSDEVVYADKLAYAFPYGLAGFLNQEDDPALAAQMKNKYEVARTKAAVANYGDVLDQYGEEEE